MFEGCDWRGRRLWVCRSGMALWTSLNYVSSKYHYLWRWPSGGGGMEIRKPTREEQKETIRAFAGDTHGCRCRDCRYRRIFGPRPSKADPKK